MPSIPRNDTVRTASSQKNLLRQQCIQRRTELNETQKKQWDTQLGLLLVDYIMQHALTDIGIYLPIRHEPDLTAAYRQLHELHITLAVPVVTEKNAPLMFAQWQPDTLMTEGAFHTLIPQTVVPMTPGTLLLPCVGFNRQRYRLGYGGGYFDRTLDTPQKPHTIGIAYELSCVQFTQEPHDIPLDVIMTERQIMTEDGRN